MTLVQLVKDLYLVVESDTIYAAEPWTMSSEAIAAAEPEAGGMAVEINDLQLTYFLEVAIAREVLEGWKRNRHPQPSLHEECLRLIEYARNDA
jgi:hypothetical protein